MAYNIDGLSPAGAQSKAGDAPQMWTYKSADAKATVAASGYFNSVSSVLKVGDLVMIYDTATPAASLHIVLTNSAAGVVDVSAGTDISVA
jgi:hypothetical protein|tara:strand:- start:1477 stop:1746 length:270 start_codon:yes stop_codon:yes gene_type:complete